MKKIQIIIIFFLALLYIFLFPENSLAGTDLPWSTTFNCAEWAYPAAGPSGGDCTGLSYAWPGDGCTTDTPSKKEQVTSAANMASGGGGRGQRNWVGDGTNISSNGLKVVFNTMQTEFWMRWYMRYESGFT